MIFFRFCTSTCKNLIVFSFNTSRPLWVHSLHFFHISLFLQPELRMSRGQIIQNMGQLNDVEFCNNLLFLLNHSPESISARSNDHFWSAVADVILGNNDSASIRLEQVQKDDPTYLGGIILHANILKQSNKEKSKRLDAELKEARSSGNVFKN